MHVQWKHNGIDNQRLGRELAQRRLVALMMSHCLKLVLFMLSSYSKFSKLFLFSHFFHFIIDFLDPACTSVNHTFSNAPHS